MSAWRQAGKTLLAKAIAEFSYEELLTPVAEADHYRLDFPAAGYIFTATRGAFGAWRVDEDSVRRKAKPRADSGGHTSTPATGAPTDGHEASAVTPSDPDAPPVSPGKFDALTVNPSNPDAPPVSPGDLDAPAVSPGGHDAPPIAPGNSDAPAVNLGGHGTPTAAPGGRDRDGDLGLPADDPLLFLTDARATLGLDGPTTAEALRDLTATWTADAQLLATLPTAAGLAELSYAELESWQQGHPCILLNKGRLGFSAADARRYAPEHRQSFRLPWLAAHRDLAGFAAVPGLDAATLLAEELDPGTRAQFAARLEQACQEQALPAADYVWLPVHPFHLENAVRPLFAQQLAEGLLVELGEAPDRYRALASVRTLVNVDHPGKRNVKLALLIRNTLVWRGLPAESAAQAPEITRWLHELPERDRYLTGRMDLLGEVASVAVHHPGFAAVPDAPYRYHELLGAIWREPATSYLAEGERTRSLATLLLSGSDGRALIAELIERSGADARGWLAAFLHAVLPGLLHALHGNGIAFCPHGENTLVVYGPDELPRRIMLKDFAEDVKLRTEDLPGYAGLAAQAKAVLLRWRPEQLAHSILSAMFTGHFRFLTPILERQLGVSEAEFWNLVQAELMAYRAEFPELATQHEEYGFTAPEFDRVSLNREQLTGGGFHDRAEKDENFDVLHRTVPNPLAQVTAPTR